MLSFLSLLLVFVFLPLAFQQNDHCFYDIGRIKSGTFPDNNELFLATGKATFDLGHYDRCQRIPNAHYCLVHLGNGSLYSSPQIGLCMPLTCSADNVSTFIDSLIQPLYSIWHSFLTPININSVSCPPKESSPLTRGAIALIVILIVLLCLVITGGVLEYFLGPAPPIFRSKNSIVLSAPSQTGEYSFRDTSLSHDAYILMENQSSLPTSHRKTPIQFKKFLYGVRRFFETFSPISNSENLFSSSPIGGLEVLNGLRVISMFWVILGNTLYLSVLIGFENFDAFSNEIVSTFGFQILLNATYAGDIFFFISGFLVTFHLFDKFHRKTKFAVIVFYIHRLWRLTPTYVLALVFWWQILPLVVSGPYSNETVIQSQRCDSDWWLNLLYINNFFGKCFEWGWYLALNLQFCLLSPIFIWILYKRKTTGYLTLVLTMSASLVLIMIITHSYTLEVHWFSPKRQEATLLIEIMPYTRIPSFLLGILCGFLILRRIQSEDSVRTASVRRTKVILGTVGLVLGGFLMFLSLFGTYSLYNSNVSWGRAADITFMTFGRFGFTFGLSLVMFLVMSGHGVLIHRILGSSFWTPLARLTYSAYLYHPFVIQSTLLSTRNLIHFSVWHFLLLNSLAFYFVSYLIAYISWIVVEGPTRSLERLLTRTFRVM